MDEQLQDKIEQLMPLGKTICTALDGEVHKLGFAAQQEIGIDFGAACFSLKRDPFSGENSLEGIWQDAKGQRTGTILIHSDGSFFAEYDVLRQHPKDARWFVEAVTAWGRDNIIKSEPRLLAALT